MVRRGRGHSQSGRLRFIENTGYAEKSGRNIGHAGFGDKGVLRIARTVRSGSDGDGCKLLRAIRKFNITVIDIGHGRDRKLLARFGSGRVSGHRPDGVLDHDGRKAERIRDRGAASVIFDSFYVNAILAGSTKGEVKVVANGIAICHSSACGNQINGRGAIRSGCRCC